MLGNGYQQSVSLNKRVDYIKNKPMEKIKITCNTCSHIEEYEFEEDLYQDGKMWVLEDNTNVCNKCLEE